MKHKKTAIIIEIIIVVVIFLIFITNKFPATGKSVGTQQVKIVPLTNTERTKIIQIITSSEFIKDVPEKDPISLMFFTFENKERIWQDGFLIGNNQLLSQGNPTIYLSLHSKYISEFNEKDLCETIKKANKNGDLGFYSNHNKAKLLWKYKGMLKYRDCFGF